MLISFHQGLPGGGYLGAEEQEGSESPAQRRSPPKRLQDEVGGEQTQSPKVLCLCVYFLFWARLWCVCMRTSV